MNSNFTIILIIILVLIFIQQRFMEGFYTIISKIKILVFVSTSCPHCHDYINNIHDNAVQWANSVGTSIELIYSEDDSMGLFKKYYIKHVPSCIIIEGNGAVIKQLSGPITLDSIKSTFNSIISTINRI